LDSDHVAVDIGARTRMWCSSRRGGPRFELVCGRLISMWAGSNFSRINADR